VFKCFHRLKGNSRLSGIDMVEPDLDALVDLVLANILRDLPGPKSDLPGIEKIRSSVQQDLP
jgi:hypothetical protein